MARAPGDVTQLLAELQDGRPDAACQLIPVVYDELHRLARRQMRHERPDHTLQATALVHEAYLRLVNHRERTWQNRAHFIAVAAQAMRRILVDYARARGTAISPFDIAVIYTGLGDRDQAFGWLAKAYDNRPRAMLSLKVNPRLDPLRSDPRFATLMRRMRVFDAN